MSALPDIPPPAIHVVEATDEIRALDLEGEFDISMAPEIIKQAARAYGAGKHLIVNLSDATFIDSSTIHALFTADEAAKKAGRVFVLQFGTHAAVKRVLGITGADRTLPTAKTREAAIELILGV